MGFALRKRLVDPAVCCFNFIPGNSVIGRSIRNSSVLKGRNLADLIKGDDSGLDRFHSIYFGVIFFIGYVRTRDFDVREFGNRENIKEVGKSLERIRSIV